MARELAENALCRPEDVKSALDNSSISSYVDDTLIFYINGFSTMVEGPRYCNREFVKKARTQYFDGVHMGIEYPRRRLFLIAPPVDLTLEFTLWDDRDRAWTDETKLVLWQDFRIDANTGIISLFEDGVFSCEPYVIRVDYTGGLVSGVNTDAEIIPDDLRMACAVQCAHWYRTANDPGATQIQPVGGGNISFTPPTKILPNVREILEGYRRHQY